jgi:hypothetical protein
VAVGQAPAGRYPCHTASPRGAVWLSWSSRAMSLGTTTRAMQSPDGGQIQRDIRMRRPSRLGRERVPGGKEPRGRAAAVEGERGDVQLQTAVFWAGEQRTRQGGPGVPGGRSPRLPTRSVVTAARKAGTRSGMVLSFPQVLSVPLMSQWAVAAGPPRPGQGEPRGPRPPGAGCHCPRSGDPRWTTGSATAVPQVGRAAVPGPG